MNSNLYGMTLGSDGNLYVADAGANTVYQVNPTTGAIKVAAVIPGITVTREDLPPVSYRRAHRWRTLSAVISPNSIRSRPVSPLAPMVVSM